MQAGIAINTFSSLLMFHLQLAHPTDLSVNGELFFSCLSTQTVLSVQTKDSQGLFSTLVFKHAS